MCHTTNAARFGEAFAKKAEVCHVLQVFQALSGAPW
jgi:hypothetical protein